MSDYSKCCYKLPIITSLSMILSIWANISTPSWPCNPSDMEFRNSTMDSSNLTILMLDILNLLYLYFSIFQSMSCSSLISLLRAIVCNNSIPLKSSPENSLSSVSVSFASCLGVNYWCCWCCKLVFKSKMVLNCADPANWSSYGTMSKIWYLQSCIWFLSQGP